MRKVKLDDMAKTIDELRKARAILGELYASVTAVDSGYAGIAVSEIIHSMIVNLTVKTNALIDEYDNLSGIPEN